MNSPALFALPRLATSYVHVGIITLGLPVIVLQGSGEGSKGFHLGGITAIASVLSVVALYAAGWLADRARSVRQGRLYVVAGLLAMIPAIWVFDASRSYALLLTATIWLVCARALADAAHLPLVASGQGGSVISRTSGFLSFYYVAGAGLGAVAFATGRAPLGGLVLTLAATAAFAASAAPEPARGEGPVARTPLRSLLQGDIVLLLSARVLFLAGTFVVSTFFVFLVRDLIQPVGFERAAARLFAMALAGGVVFALPASWLVDRYGDRQVLIGAGFALGVAIAGFVLIGPRSQGAAVVSMLLYGAAFSTVLTSGLTLLLSLVPAPDVAGRLLAIATASTFVSQGLASAAGAVVLDPMNAVFHGGGYLAMAGVAEIFLIAGGVLLALMRPRGDRRATGVITGTSADSDGA